MAAAAQPDVEMASLSMHTADSRLGGRIQNPGVDEQLFEQDPPVVQEQFPEQEPPVVEESGEENEEEEEAKEDNDGENYH